MSETPIESALVRSKMKAIVDKSVTSEERKEQINVLESLARFFGIDIESADGERRIAP